MKHYSFGNDARTSGVAGSIAWTVLTVFISGMVITAAEAKPKPKSSQDTIDWIDESEPVEMFPLESTSDWNTESDDLSPWCDQIDRYLDPYIFRATRALEHENWTLAERLSLEGIQKAISVAKKHPYGHGFQPNTIRLLKRFASLWQEVTRALGSHPSAAPNRALFLVQHLNDIQAAVLEFDRTYYGPYFSCRMHRCSFEEQQGFMQELLNFELDQLMAPLRTWRMSHAIVGHPKLILAVSKQSLLKFREFARLRLYGFSFACDWHTLNLVLRETQELLNQPHLNQTTLYQWVALYEALVTELQAESCNR